MESKDQLFAIETLQDWQLNAEQIVAEQPETGGGGASNSNSCCNNSADEP